MNPPSTDASTGTGAEALSWSDYSQMYRVLHNVAKVKIYLRIIHRLALTYFLKIPIC